MKVNLWFIWGMIILLSLNLKSDFFRILNFDNFSLKLFHVTCLLSIPFLNFRFLKRGFTLLYFSPFFLISLSDLLLNMKGFNSSLEGIFKFSFWFLCVLIGNTLAHKLGKDFIRVLRYGFTLMIFLVAIKNLYFLETIFDSFKYGIPHPQAPWNFYNITVNSNREIAFVSVYSLFLFYEKSKMSKFLITFSFVNSFLARVQGSLLVFMAYLTRNFVFRLRIVFAFIFSIILILTFIEIDINDFFEYGSGRIYLWYFAAIEISSFNPADFLIGKGLGSVISIFQSGESSFELLLSNRIEDFHNFYLNVFFEQGVIGFCMIVYFIIFPIISNIKKTGSSIELSKLSLILFLLLTYGLISNHPMDPIFAFIFGGFCRFQSQN